jgi:hypothetical protein
MKPRIGAVVAVLLLATCGEDAAEKNRTNLESAEKALGVVPATEVAVWRKVGAGNTPDGRYLQAAAFDETRRVVVMFGGTNMNPNTGTASPNQETWEWSPATGKWTNRTGTGTAPNARSGAAMVYDSARAKFVLFGGRAGSGVSLEDTWEWNPATGEWTDVSAAGSHPSARCQHQMVYEKSNGKILLFGGGRSDPSSYDGTGVQVSLGDTWEYDPTAYVWKQLSPGTAPSVRHDFGLVWDSSRNLAVLFAGLQTDNAGISGVPKQDIWDWDPTAATWTERTAPGTKPSQRHGMAMAFDASRKLVVVFGGWDIGTGYSLNDLWDWEPTTGTWTRRLTGSEGSMPAPRMYASLLADDAGGRLELVAGDLAPSYSTGTGGYYPDAGIVIVPPGGPIGGYYGASGSREVWELNPATPTFTDRTPPLDVPTARYNQAMAFNPVTGKSYMFGGYDSMTGQALNDLWAWDGKTWALQPADISPPARSDCALAYDPIRKSLILFGGLDQYSGSFFDDTWEWTSAGKWAELSPVASPDARMGHGMVTDTTRNKVLLFSGMGDYMRMPVGPMASPMRNDVWEWDGQTMTWTNRTPTALTSSPYGREYPQIGYDPGRRKLFLYDGYNYGGSATTFWEWDPISAGWESHTTSDNLGYLYAIGFVFDTVRKRGVLLSDPGSSPTGAQQTLEVDPRGPTWYVRTLSPSPGYSYGNTMAFDSTRGVAVFFGNSSTNPYASETWEYSVTNLGNGEGCTAAFATLCASGSCVDGVCCEVAACTGACKSCGVPGAEGTCVLAKAGTEVAGSCADGQACDGTGACKSKNGQPCTAATACASGFCADGVCCDGACTGTCAACNQVGLAGKCSPYLAGTDPQGECGQGSGVCKSTCDGVGSCSYPQVSVSCGNCYTCDGYGSCSNYDYYCGFYGGLDGGRPIVIDAGVPIFIDAGRPIPPPYDASIPIVGGAGGSIPNSGGSGGALPGLGGSGGGLSGLGGRDGGTSNSGGSGGPLPGLGGATGVNPGVGGTGGNVFGAGGVLGGSDAGVGDASSKAKLSSGCSCELGSSQPSRASRVVPFLVAGAALLLIRKRRRG